MRKHYVKPELETVEVMVELGFAQSIQSIEVQPTHETQTYILEEGFYHQTQGEQWNETTTTTWF